MCSLKRLSAEPENEVHSKTERNGSRSRTDTSDRLDPDGCEGMSAFERHYSVKELSKLWALSAKTIFRRFVNEPGVLLVKREETRTKRSYSQLRIPESVAIRVHERYVVKKKS